MAARARITKPMSPAEPEPREDDGVPSFTTTLTAAEYNGPVLMRIDGIEYRMRTDRSFAASLVYLRQLRNAGVREAQFAVLDHLAGPEATNRLLQAAELEPAVWNKVVSRALDHVLGRHLEDEEGN